MTKKLKLLKFRQRLISGWKGVAFSHRTAENPLGGTLLGQLEYLRDFLFKSDELEKLLGIEKNENNI